MDRKYIWKNFAVVGITLLATLALNGCATQNAIVSQQFAARTRASTYRHVAVLPFQGPGGEEVAQEFEAMLSAATFNGQPYFTVIDRMTLQRALAELKLQQSGLTDPKNIKSLGKFIGAEAIYGGTVQMGPPSFSHYTETHYNCASNGKCSPYQASCTTKYVDFKLIPREVVIETAQIIYDQTTERVQTSNFCSDGQGVEEATDLMRGAAKKLVFDEVRKDVAPYNANVAVHYKDDKDAIADADKEAFAGSIAFAKSGRFDRACETWRQLAPRNQQSVAIQYNAAVCDEIGGELDKSYAEYQVVDRTLKAPDKDVNDALVRLKNLIDQREKARRQTQEAQASADAAAAAEAKVPTSNPDKPKPKPKPKPAPAPAPSTPDPTSNAPQ